MKTAHTSDLHVDEHDRFDETCRLLSWMAGDIAAWGPDLIVVAGDSSPGGSSVRPTTPKERMALTSYYRTLAQIAPVVIIKGNHDAVDEDVAIYAHMRTHHQIHVFTRPGVVFDEWAGIIVGIPWPSKAYLLSAFGDNTKAAVDQRCRDALRSMLLGLAAQVHGLSKTTTAYVTCVAHLNVAGSDTGGFSLIGQDVEVTQDDLEIIGADYVALGHIHKHQRIGSHIVYSGSPRRVDFGEEGEAKGYVRAEYERGSGVSVMLQQTPIPRMQTIRIDDNCRDEQGELVAAGADVRVIVTVNEERRATFDEADLLRILGADQALRVRVEYSVTPKQRVRSAAIQTAATDADRLQAYLDTLEPRPALDVVTRLFDKLLEVTV